jgi:hypothetical protein
VSNRSGEHKNAISAQVCGKFRRFDHQL